jgi:hypothetical protein
VVVAPHGQPALASMESQRQKKPAAKQQRVPGVLASEVKPEKVEWMWRSYVALCKITLFEGDPETAKTTTSLDLVARVTRGFLMPDGSSGIAASGAVVVSLEDGAADTIVPRLMAAGADLSKIRIVENIPGPDGIGRTPTLPCDLLEIEAAIKDVRAKVLVIDPLVATLAADTNSFRDQDIRRVLAPVAALAERTRVAVIVIRHLNKSSEQNPKYRGGGSIGIIGAARAAFLFGQNPDDEGSRVMACVKANLCAKPPALKYRLIPHTMTIDGEISGTVKVQWEGATAHTAMSLLAEPEGEEDSNALQDAKLFISEFLKDGPKDAKDVRHQARAAGISDRTLIRARYISGVQTQKRGFGEGQHWERKLPKVANDVTKGANYSDLASFEQIHETKPFSSNGSPKDAKNGNMASFAGRNGSLRGESLADEETL